VERPDQLSRLQDLRCDYAQGFHFGEPMVARRVSERLGGLGFIKSRNSRFNWSRLIGRDDKPMNAKTQPAKASDLASRHVTKDKLDDQVFTKPSEAEVADQVEAPIENVTVDEVPAPLEAIDTPETSVDVVELPVEPEVKLPSKREYKPLSAELRQKFAPSNRSFTREPHQSLLRPPKREFTPPVEETKPSPLRDSLRDRLRENSRHQPVPENSATRVRPPLPRLQMTDGQSAIELLKSFRSMMEKAEGPQKQAEEQATTADGGEKPKD
jgi:hypothetical protein